MGIRQSLCETRPKSADLEVALSDIYGQWILDMDILNKVILIHIE